MVRSGSDVSRPHGALAGQSRDSRGEGDGSDGRAGGATESRGGAIAVSVRRVPAPGVSWSPTHFRVSRLHDTAGKGEGFESENARAFRASWDHLNSEVRSRVQVGIYVPVFEVFPETEPTLSVLTSLLGKLSLTDVLFWCARLNHVLTSRSNLTHEQKQAFGLRQFFSHAEIARLDRFCAAQRRSPAAVTVFFRGQLLELVRWAALFCDDQPDDGTTFEDPEVRRIFAQACLIASDVWARRTYGDTLTLERGVESARLRTLGPFRKSAEGSLTSSELAQDLGRGWRIFCEQMLRLDPGFETLFHSATGLSTEDYFVCWSALLTNYAKSNAEATIFSQDTSAPRTACPELFARFLAIESQPPAALRAALWPAITRDNALTGATHIYDYRPLRERPILRSADGRMILIDPIFAAEKCSVGPLFHVLPKGMANLLFENFGKAFEQYIGEVLERTFPAAPGLVSPLARNTRGRGAAGDQFEIDATLNYVTDLVLFEIKAVWGRESDLAPERSDALLDLLRRRFSVTGDGVKGVGQLARVVEAIVERRWLGPMNEFAAVQRIFPVIVVHDRLLGSPGFGAFVLDEFRKALGGLVPTRPAEFSCGQLNIIAPIVLTAEDLELLEVSVERSGLRDLLTEYSRSSPDRMSPFSAYLAEISASGRVIANRALAATSMDVLTRAMERLFHVSAQRDA